MHVMLFEIFTDGSSIINTEKKIKSCSASFKIYINNKKIAEGNKFFKDGTNNFGEAYAILFSLKTFEKMIKKVDSKILSYPISINVYSDSLISVLACREWIYKWIISQKNGVLRTSDGSIVANQEIFKEIHDVYLNNILFNIKFIHISSHVIDSKEYIKNIKDLIDIYSNNKVVDISKDLFIPKKFKIAKEKFKKKNGYEIPNVEFLRLLVYNYTVDRSASLCLKHGLGS